MAHDILHSGIIEDTTGGCITVKIVQTSACASCKIADHCHASEQKEKLIEVRGQADAGTFSKGDRVKVIVSSDAGAKAVVLAFLIPFLLLVGVVFVCSLFTRSEPVMALAGLASLIPYYILLYVFKGAVSRQISFRVEH